MPNDLLTQLTQSSVNAQWVTAIFTALMAAGTLAVAILAVFGDPIRAFIFRPKLKMRLNNKQGELVKWSDGTPGIYYHLKIENHGRSTAKGVRVLCHSIAKSRPSGSFAPEPMAAPERLMWRWSQFFGKIRDIPAGYIGRIGEVCDLGCVNEGSNRFQITAYAGTESFPGFLCPNESMRLDLAVAADNFAPETSCHLEISWDGKWTSNLHEMKKHLVINEIGDSA